MEAHAAGIARSLMSEHKFPFRKRRVTTLPRFRSEDSPEIGQNERAEQGKLTETERPRRERRKQASAQDKMMDLLARRNHSELELRRKLSEIFPATEVDAAIKFALENNWMLPPDELSERLALELGRKRKGHRFIQKSLKEKGLPQTTVDRDEEYRKALEIVTSKLGNRHLYEEEDGVKLDYEAKKKVNQKIYRLLVNRGFEDETIRRILNEHLFES
jgi:regulatory protein